MMRFPVVQLFSVVVLLACAVPAQSKPPAPSNADPNFAPIAWMIGTWTSNISDFANDATTHLEERFRWAPNHKAILSVASWNGSAQYNGMYAYNPAAKNFSLLSTSSEGELATGTATADPDGKMLHEEFDMTHADGTTSHLRSTMVRDGDNAYWLTVLMQKNGEWAQVLHIRYERKSE